MSTVIKQHITDRFALYNGDSAEVLAEIPDNSIDYEIYSPPFASLYTYSNSERDLGNCRSNEEFFQQFRFIGEELLRALAPGRLMSVHCMDIPAMKERDGYIGLIDFPGRLISMFTEMGFIYHSRTAIWKDPLIEATRTKALGLMHKQLQKDSAMCRSGLPDYLLSFRKPGENMKAVSHPDGMTEYAGDSEPAAPKRKPKLTSTDAADAHHRSQIQTEDPIYSHQVWRKYASPVWMDIRQSNTLNARDGRDKKDERHICPLQLDVIERALTLYSNPGDTVMTPFLGIGSEIYQALVMGRKGIGVELKESYYNQAVKNCTDAASMGQMSMWEGA